MKNRKSVDYQMFKTLIILLLIGTPIWGVAENNTNIEKDFENERNLEDRPIQILERVPPKYPTLALYKKTEGWVKVIFTVTTNGDVIDVGVVDAEPKNVFDYAAMEAAKQFKFLAPVKNGKLVEQRATQTIEFELPKNLDQLKNEYSINDFIREFSLDEIMDFVETENLPDDVFLIIKSINIKSKIKPHKRTLRELVLRINPDKNGKPNSVQVVQNELDDKVKAEGIEFLKNSVLQSSRIVYENFNGYYNPGFKMMVSKNLPVRAYSDLEAKSMPVPEFSYDYHLKARLTINEKGQIAKINEAKFSSEPIDEELFKMFLKFVRFKEARKKYKAVTDEIDFHMIFSIVQKSDVKQIQSNWLKKLNDS